jgi:hypothetical protein
MPTRATVLTQKVTNMPFDHHFDYRKFQIDQQEAVLA